MSLSEAYEEWRKAEDEYQNSTTRELSDETRKLAGDADEAFEDLSAIAFQQGYDPAGPLGIVEFVMREIAK